MKKITLLFNTVLTADKETSRKAAREVRKAVYGPGDQDEYKVLKSIINNAPADYKKIQEDWRQENFVVALSVLYFLHDRENQPDFLFPWFFQLLQHKNGNIRQAAVRMVNHELGLLTYHIRFPGRSSDFHGFSREQGDRILSGLEMNLHSLAENSWQEIYQKYKFINDLPSGTYKSVQLILGYLEDLCDEAYPLPETESLDKRQTIEEILKRRKGIEQKLVEMLKDTESDFTLDHVREAIYNEEDNDDMMRVVAMFDRGACPPKLQCRRGDASELDNILELVTDAWNYFPHKVLGGISPAEKLLEHRNKSKT
jgi:hypothetical protein